VTHIPYVWFSGKITRGKEIQSKDPHAIIWYNYKGERKESFNRGPQKIAFPSGLDGNMKDETNFWWKRRN